MIKSTTKLVSLLGKRFELTHQIGKYKKARKLQPVDAERERQQFTTVKEFAAKIGLNPEFADRFLRCVIDEVVRNHTKL